MPWSIVEKTIDNARHYCLQKDSDKTIVKGSCHTDREMTRKMQQALYANEGKHMYIDEFFLKPGGEIKSLGENKIGGLLVRFSNKNAPDLVGDYFDRDTDFGFEGTKKTPIYLNHRQPIEAPGGKFIVVKQKIGEGTLSKSEEGILIEAILYSRKLYKEALKEMGWSSGTASHLVDRTKTGKAYHIDQWPLGVDASLTHGPCDPDNIVTLKSFSASAYKSISDNNFEIFESDVDTYFEAESETDEPPMTFQKHSETVEAAVEEFATKASNVNEQVSQFISRVRNRLEFREAKDGRTISQPNRQKLAQNKERLKSAMETMQQIHDDLESLMMMAEPKPKARTDASQPMSIGKSLEGEDLAAAVIAEAAKFEELQFNLTAKSRA